MSPAQVFDTLLTIYVWIVAVVIIFFLFLIARFFQRKSGQRSYFELYVVPAVLFLMAGARYLFWGTSYVGDPIADCLLFFAGATTIGLSSYLFILMTGGRR